MATLTFPLGPVNVFLVFFYFLFERGGVPSACLLVFLGSPHTYTHIDTNKNQTPKIKNKSKLKIKVQH